MKNPKTKSQVVEETWAEKVLRYRKPGGWIAMVHEIFGFPTEWLWEKLQELLNSVQNNKFTAITGGHEVSKTFGAALCVNCFLHLNPDSRVIITAHKDRAIREQLWPEVARIHAIGDNRLKQMGQPQGLGSRCLTLKIVFEGCPSWFAVGFKGEDKSIESFQGFHSPRGRLLYVIDEASAMGNSVPTLMFDAHRKMVTNDRCRFLMSGNPIHSTGPLRDALRPGSKFHQITINALETPNVKTGREIIPGMVTKGRIDELREEIGEDHPFWRMAVLGKFPEREFDSLIPPDWIDLSNDRWEELHKDDGFKPKGRKILGADIAGAGADRTVFCFRQGACVLKWERWGNLKTTESSGQLIVWMRRDWDVASDAIGIGEGVAHPIEEEMEREEAKSQEKGKEFDFPEFKGVKGSESTDKRDMTGTFGFTDLRSYLLWKLREALDPNGDIKLAMPRDEKVKMQFTAPSWRIVGKGKIEVESKKSLKKKLGGKSPDELDATMNTFAFPDDDLYELPLPVFGSSAEDEEQGKEMKQGIDEETEDIIEESDNFQSLEIDLEHSLLD